MIDKLTKSAVVFYETYVLSQDNGMHHIGIS